MLTFFFLFLKNEPGAVGTPRWMPPGLGCHKPNPFVSGQSFHFQMTGALGDATLIPLSLTVRVLRREQIVTSATRRANREEKNMVKENNEVSRCKTAGALLHRDCWRNRDEAVRQRLGRDSRLAAARHSFLEIVAKSGQKFIKKFAGKCKH